MRKVLLNLFPAQQHIGPGRCVKHPMGRVRRVAGCSRIALVNAQLPGSEITTFLRGSEHFALPSEVR